MGNDDDNGAVLAHLEEILSNQEQFKEAFEEFQEEVLEKLDNLNTPSGEFNII